MAKNTLEQPIIEPNESMRDIQPHLESNINIPTDTMPSVPLIPSVSISNNATPIIESTGTNPDRATQVEVALFYLFIYYEYLHRMTVSTNKNAVINRVLL